MSIGRDGFVPAAGGGAGKAVAGSPVSLSSSHPPSVPSLHRRWWSGRQTDWSGDRKLDDDRFRHLPHWTRCRLRCNLIQKLLEEFDDDSGLCSAFAVAAFNAILLEAHVEAVRQVHIEAAHLRCPDSVFGHGRYLTSYSSEWPQTSATVFAEFPPRLSRPSSDTTFSRRGLRQDTDGGTGV